MAMKMKYAYGAAEPCDACGKTDQQCVANIRKNGRACCPRCQYTATHNQDEMVQVEEPPPPPVRLPKVSAISVGGGPYAQVAYLIECETCGTVDGTSATYAARRCEAHRDEHREGRV